MLSFLKTFLTGTKGGRKGVIFKNVPYERENQ